MLLQVEKFKYLGILFMSEGRGEWELNEWIWASAAVIQILYWSVMMKRELSALHKLCVVTERMKLSVPLAELFPKGGSPLELGFQPFDVEE